MIELKRVEKNSGYLEVLEKINTEAIPECERNSLDDLIDTGAEVLGIFLNGSPVGYFVLREYQSMLYLAYFAVRCDCRSKGTGSQALRKLIDENKVDTIISFQRIYVDIHSAIFGEFVSVSYKMPQDLLDLARITHKRSGDRRIHVDHELKAVIFGKRKLN